MNRTPIAWAIGALGTVVVLALAWWLLAPIVVNRTVDEPFPVTGGSSAVVAPTAPSEAMQSIPTATVAAADNPPATTTPAPTPTESRPTAEPTPEATADSAAPMAEPTAVPTEEPTATVEPTTVPTQEPTAIPAPTIAPSATPAPVAAAPQVLAMGNFYPLEHDGAGTATIYQQPDGSRVLRFENFTVQNGPQLHVWLVAENPVPNMVGQVPASYYDLGALKGNQGNQNYDIPAEVDLSLFNSVVIWCVPFSVSFAAAPIPTTDVTASITTGETAVPPTEPLPYAPIPLTVELPNRGPAPEISNDTWINSDTSLRLADLRGKVVVVEFWTFDCYNCQNVTPYIMGWDTKYAGQDFEIISVHYPEFTYEREYDNVVAAVQAAGIQYPVAIDNEGTTWRAYSQRYWPTWYVLDKQGNIRYQHIGEGGYIETEGVIQALLAEEVGR